MKENTTGDWHTFKQTITAVIILLYASTILVGALQFPIDSGLTNLHKAAMKGDCADATILLTNNRGINAQTHSGLTPLHYAALAGQQAMARLLIDRGADYTITDTRGRLAADLVSEDNNYFSWYLSDKLAAKGIKPVVLTNYKNDYVCKRVAIFLNNTPPTPDDPIVTQLGLCLQQKACPIIVTSPVLHMHCRREQPSTTSHQTNGPQSQKPTIIDQQRKRLVLDHWNIYGNKKENPSFYLLIPLFKNNILSPGFCGFRDELAANKLETFDCNLLSIDQSAIDYLFAGLHRNIFFKNKQMDRYGGPWNIYLNGHGGTNSSIAGMSIMGFKNFLSFLSTSIRTNFLFYDTCHGGGANLITPYLNRYGEEESYDFAIAENCTTDLPACAAPISKFTPGAHFVNFFSYLEQLFTKKEDPANSWKKASLNPWKAVLSTLVKPGCQSPVAQTPLLRLPENNYFLAESLSKEVFVFTYEKLLESLSYNNRARELLIHKETPVLLLYPPIITPPVTITTSMKKIVSMNPDNGLHYFKEIKSNHTRFEDFLDLFNLGVHFNGYKVFVIRNYNNIATHMIIKITGWNGVAECVCYFKVNNITTIRSNTFYRGDFCRISIDDKTNNIYVSKIKESDYKKSIEDILKTLLKKDRALVRPEPWHIESELLMHFAYQQLDMWQPLTEKQKIALQELRKKYHV